MTNHNHSQQHRPATPTTNYRIHKKSQPDVPNLDCTVLGARVHPLSVLLEADSRDITRVAVKAHDLHKHQRSTNKTSRVVLRCIYRVGRCGIDLEQTDVLIPGCSKVLLVWSDLKAIHLLQTRFRTKCYCAIGIPSHCTVMCDSKCLAWPPRTCQDHMSSLHARCPHSS